MFSLTCFNRSFTPSWRMFLLTCITVALFVRLGLWQLERADEKKQLLTLFQHQSNQPPIAWDAQDNLPKQYQLLKVKGHFLPTTLLLDNQHYQHQFGYDVLSPFILSDGSVVLIDRGWIKAEQQRTHLPKIEVPAEEIQLTGSVYYPSTKHWLLGPALEEKRATMAIVELVDVSLISHFLHKSVYPFIIRLNPAEAHGYVREWAIVSMPPTRHYGYAVQWFAIAGVIIILFIGLNLKKKS
ncbi:MAG: SURF1 family protein [Legionellaceae bacterium]|nr:SURF1 family protein [Legionellaceae bacterium]